MVLLISLVFLLLLTSMGVASMQGATLQEKLAGSLWQRNQSFQAAETQLRLGERAVQVSGHVLGPCLSVASCAPPFESQADTIKTNTFSLQHLGESTLAANLPVGESATLYRVTAVGTSGPFLTVLESIYARVDPDGEAAPWFRRVMWRQLQ